MVLAFILAVAVGLLVKIGLSLFNQTAPYADAAGLVVGILVFLVQSGLLR